MEMRRKAMDRERREGEGRMEVRRSSGREGRWREGG